MRAVVQRVSRAQVAISGDITAKIGRGLLVFLGVASTDTESDADYLAAKIAGLRIFEDQHGKMNLAAPDVAGHILVVSQFTLYGDVAPRQTALARRRRFPAPRPRTVRVLCPANSRGRAGLRNWPVSGNDASGTGQ